MSKRERDAELCPSFLYQVGVKRMLHLIWSKDEATTTEEDGKEIKGIRSRLIECYSQLYFEPVMDLSPKDQISRVAQNVIEYVTFPWSFISESSTMLTGCNEPG